MRRMLIRTAAALSVICAATGPFTSAPAQMSSPDNNSGGQLQKWEDSIGGLSCYGECPGSFCCRT